MGEAPVQTAQFLNLDEAGDALMDQVTPGALLTAQLTLVDDFAFFLAHENQISLAMRAAQQVQRFVFHGKTPGYRPRKWPCGRILIILCRIRMISRGIRRIYKRSSRKMMSILKDKRGNSKITPGRKWSFENVLFVENYLHSHGQLAVGDGC